MMYTYTVYNTDSGEIEYATSGVAHQSEIPLASGFSIIEGSYSANRYLIQSGVAVERVDLILNEARANRNVLLAESDWTQVADSPLSDSKKAEWATYRQALRDLPSTDPIVWPTEPS